MDRRAEIVRLSLAGAEASLRRARPGWLTACVERPGGSASQTVDAGAAAVHDAWLEGRRVLWGVLPAGAATAEVVLGAGYEVPAAAADGAWLAVAPWRIGSAVGPRGGRVTFRDALRRIVRVEPVRPLREPLPTLA